MTVPNRQVEQQAYSQQPHIELLTPGTVEDYDNDNEAQNYQEQPQATPTEEESLNDEEERSGVSQ